MNPGLPAVVEQIVKDKVAAGAMFTAHDVTLEARGKGHRADHGQCKDAVHDLFARGEMGVAYTRSPISVTGGNPYLYHQRIDDPNNYANVRGGQPQVNSQVNTGGTITVPDGDGDDDDDDDGPAAVLIPAASPSFLTRSAPKNSRLQVSGRQPDARNVLSIPIDLIRKMGLVAGNKVAIYSAVNGSAHLEIHKHDKGNQADTNRIAEYTVDKNGQIRITKGCINLAGIASTVSAYDVEDKTGDSEPHIVVKSH